MATIIPGTDATINATTIEGQLYQLVHWININEAFSGGNNNRFSLTKGEDGIATSAFTLEGSLSRDSITGVASSIPTSYLVSAPFLLGSPAGTIKGVTFSEYFIEAILYALIWQGNISKNPQRVNGVSLSFDYTTGVYSGSLSLPYATTLSSSGTISEVAIEWLLT